jgi:hypothetical protein
MHAYIAGNDRKYGRTTRIILPCQYQIFNCLGLAWSKSRKVRSLGEIGIERLLRNFVILGSPNNPRAKERNSGYIMVRKGQRIQVASARDRRVSPEES